MLLPLFPNLVFSAVGSSNNRHYCFGAIFLIVSLPPTPTWFSTQTVFDRKGREEGEPKYFSEEENTHRRCPSKVENIGSFEIIETRDKLLLISFSILIPSNGRWKYPAGVRKKFVFRSGNHGNQKLYLFLPIRDTKREIRFCYECSSSPLFSTEDMCVINGFPFFSMWYFSLFSF